MLNNKSESTTDKVKKVFWMKAISKSPRQPKDFSHNHKKVARIILLTTFILLI